MSTEEQQQPKPKKPRSRAERFMHAAQALLDACDEADETLGKYVDEVNQAISELNDAVEALNAQMEQLTIVEDALQDLREVRDEYQEVYDNLSERSQEGEKGQALSTICDINLDPEMPDVEVEVPGECDAPNFDPVRDCAQECIDAELP